ncbi:helix-turn-helix domain-containing protein [Rhodococcus ruber]|uniref:helix-turn-helix domain-containing protein n=1 Tax=Rhodococcus ruber TaxID=1830 RepID=UPI00315D8A49
MLDALERATISELLRAGKKQYEIARALGRSASTVSPEIQGTDLSIPTVEDLQFVADEKREVPQPRKSSTAATKRT